MDPDRFLKMNFGRAIQFLSFSSSRLANIFAIDQSIDSTIWINRFAWLCFQNYRFLRFIIKKAANWLPDANPSRPERLRQQVQKELAKTAEKYSVSPSVRASMRLQEIIGKDKSPNNTFAQRKINQQALNALNDRLWKIKARMMKNNCTKPSEQFADYLNLLCWACVVEVFVSEDSG